MTYQTQDDYFEAMQRCRQFATFGVAPIWNPEKPDISGFIRDEVVRQFHDPAVYTDGGIRMEGMKRAWEYAQEMAADDALPDISDIQMMGRMIEHRNAEGFRHHEVHIGGRLGAPFRLIPQMMETWERKLPDVDREDLGTRNVAPFWRGQNALWASYMPEEEILERWEEFCADIATVDDAYLAFQAAHPFGDGNGRTGKTIYCWLARKLDHPVLVRDWFGGGNP